MSKFLDQTGLSHFWSKIKTLLVGKADKTYVDDACDGVYNMVSGELAGKANTIHTHYHNQINPPISSVGTSYAAGSYISAVRACRTFGLPADQIIIEQSTDGGVTWTEGIHPSTNYRYSDSAKEALFNGARSTICIPLKNGVISTDCILRITVTAMKYNVPSDTAETEKYNYWNSNYISSNERYCTLDFGYFWVCAYSNRISIEHQVASGLNPNTWISDGTLQNASGWSGDNYVRFNGYTFGGSTAQTGNYWNQRFIFRTAASDGSYDDSKLSSSYNTSPQCIYEISCYGSNCWTAANEMMKTDRPYTFPTLNNLAFAYPIYTTNSITTTSFLQSNSRVYAKDGFRYLGKESADNILTADGGVVNKSAFATAEHTHKTFDDDITMNGDLYVENISVNSEIDASRIIEDGDYLANRYAPKTHTHDDYVTTTYLNSMRYVSEQDLDTQIQNTEGLIQDVDDRVTALEQSSGSTSSASHKFQLLGRQTLSANGVADLYTYLAAYDELMIIVRTQSSASVTIGPSNTTSGSSGFLCSKSLTGTLYTKIMVNKTDEGYMAWDVGGELGWSNNTAYRYLRNYSASGTVTMTVVVHGR